MRTLGVIPVRMQSQRLPEKPLKDICGLSLVERVWRQASQSQSLSRIVIATDSDEIQKVASEFGAEVIMTGQVETGSDRVAAALEVLEAQGESFECIANIQGDMPFIKPEVIDSLIIDFQSRGVELGMGTIASPILSEDEFQRSASVKVVCSTSGQALYFSRAQIPFPRNAGNITPQEPIGLKHIGLYVFSRQTLATMNTLSQSLPERREGLEQLRLLCAGVPIYVTVIPREVIEPQVEVDTPEDLERAREIAKQR